MAIDSTLHSKNARKDKKCVDLMRKMGAEGYGIYWMFIEFLLEYTEQKVEADDDTIAYNLGLEPEAFKAFINIAIQNGLIVKDKGFYYSESLTKRIKDVSERGRKAVEARYKGKQESTDVYESMPTNTKENKTIQDSYSSSYSLDNNKNSQPEISEVREVNPQAQIHQTSKQPPDASDFLGIPIPDNLKHPRLIEALTLWNESLPKARPPKKPKNAVEFQMILMDAERQKVTSDQFFGLILAAGAGAWASLQWDKIPKEPEKPVQQPSRQPKAFNVPRLPSAKDMEQGGAILKTLLKGTKFDKVGGVK